METQTIFRIILPVIIVAFAAHREYYVKKHTKPDAGTLKKREESVASKLAGLLGVIGFISIIAFATKPNWL